MALSVIGAGFGRTGTTSLKLALEGLGLGPCFHMKEFFTAPNSEELRAKWHEVAFAPGAPAWDDVFAGYRSAVDWPASAYYRELADNYPQAKVILTVRDPERWWDSASRTIFSGTTSPEAMESRTDMWGQAMNRIIGEGVLGGVKDRAGVIAIFRRHIEEVKRTIPPERLLVSGAGEGWEPLCRFLGVAVPDMPYPHENTAEIFQAKRAAEDAGEQPVAAGQDHASE